MTRAQVLAVFIWSRTKNLGHVVILPHYMRVTNLHYKDDSGFIRTAQLKVIHNVSAYLCIDWNAVDPLVFIFISPIKIQRPFFLKKKEKFK